METTASTSAAPAPPRLAEVRALILANCGPALADCGIDPGEATGDLDLRSSGMIDSLGFVELIASLEEELGVELDLEDLDPERLTVLDPLAAHLAAQLPAAPGGPG